MKLIRLTENDVHDIVKESVNKILREGLEDDFMAAKDKMQALRGNRERRAEFIAAAQEFQKLKELLGKTNFVKKPDAYWSSEENARRGIKKSNGTDHWRVKGNLDMKKDLDRDEREKLQVNDVDSMLGQ